MKLEAGMKKENVECLSLSSRAQGVAEIDGRKVFVDNFLPGEVATIEITKVTSKYVQGNVIARMKDSSDRVEPRCSHFGVCGGCDLEHMSDELQNDTKFFHAKQTMDFALRDVPHTFGTYTPSPKTYEYRNKVLFQIVTNESGQLSAAMYVNKTRNKVAIDDCQLISKQMQDVLEVTVDLLNQAGITAYTEHNKRGFLKKIMLRESKNAENVMIVFVTKTDDDLLSDVAQVLVEEFSHVKSVVQSIQRTDSHKQLGNRHQLLEGTPEMMDDIFGLRFLVSPDSFFQINHGQMENMYEKALSYLTEDDTKVYDFYCGVGTIGILAANGKSRKVIGVEMNRDALKQAKSNAEINDIHNIEFYGGDVEEFMESTKHENQKNATVIIDPPRTGASLAFIEMLTKQMDPKKIIYISCNPQSLARDLEVFDQAGYAIGPVDFFDMFPQTLHVETVVLMSRVDK